MRISCCFFNSPKGILTLNFNSSIIKQSPLVLVKIGRQPTDPQLLEDIKVTLNDTKQKNAKQLNYVFVDKIKKGNAK